MMAMLPLALCCLQDGQGSVWDRLEFYGNGRLREESTFDNVDSSGASVDDRHRGRFLARAGVRYEIAEGIKGEARVSTSSEGNDANNPHWDFGDGDGFNGSDVVVDQFFVDWSVMDDLRVRGGKMPHVFAQPPVYGYFIWDQDLSPAGVGALWTPASDSSSVAFDVRAAAYVATEVAGDSDPNMLGAQGNVRIPLDDDRKIQVSTSLYDWGNLDQGTTVAGNQGNTDVTDDFLIWESFVSGTVPGGLLEEMTGYIELMENLQQSSDDTGFALGGQFGRSGHQGDYNLFLVYYDLGADSLFSPVAQDDTPIPGTGISGSGDGMSGVVFGSTYYWRDNVAFKVWVLTSNADAEEDPIRLRFDMDFDVR